jgi:peptide subunit release factor 1 (eRF1)
MDSAQQRIERAVDAALVHRLRDAIGARTAAVAGVADTLAALCQRRVERLLVSRGVRAEGWRCRACGCIAVVGRRCPSCGAEMAHSDDVVEEAVESALAQNCRVDVLAGNADLDVLGGVAALLRY